MFLDLFRRPQKQRVINVKCLPRERREARAGEQDQPRFRPDDSGRFVRRRIYRGSLFDASPVCKSIIPAPDRSMEPLAAGPPAAPRRRMNNSIHLQSN
jgi:hypothetical protein